jgi:hypothetical protein
MNPSIKKNGENLEIFQSVPLMMKGQDTYGDGEWEAPAVCIFLNDRTAEYGLFHTQFLDYKDSLQATSPICFFETKEEAEKVGQEFGLAVLYAQAQS